MNSSNTDLSLQQWNDDFRKQLIPSTLIQSVEFVVGLTGNCLVIFVYSFRIKDQNSDRYFIPFLAFLDILAVTFGTLLLALDNLYYVAYPSNILCKFTLFMSTFTSLWSGHAVSIISLHRYLKVCRPHGRQMTLAWRRFALTLMSVFSILFTLPIYFIAEVTTITNDLDGVNVTGHYCIAATADDNDMSGILYFSAIVFVVVVHLVSICFLYMSIGCVIYKRFKPNKRKGLNSDIKYKPKDSAFNTNADAVKSSPESDAIKTSARVRTNFNMMFLVIVVMYVLTYIPTFLLLIISDFSDNFWFEQSALMLNVYVMFSYFYLLNHIFNPLVYTYFDFQFREEIRKIFFKCC